MHAATLILQDTVVFDDLVPSGHCSERGSGPFFSPDGKQIGFIRYEQLYRIDLVGGAPQLICNQCIGWSGTTPSWSSAGVILVPSFSERRSSEPIPVQAGEAKPVTRLDTS